MNSKRDSFLLSSKYLATVRCWFSFYSFGVNRNEKDLVQGQSAIAVGEGGYFVVFLFRVLCSKMCFCHTKTFLPQYHHRGGVGEGKSCATWI